NLISEQNVTVTMDLQPVLQLGMQGSETVSFVFSQISEYIGGLTQYGAVDLSVSSTVDWCLYAAAFSSDAADAELNWTNMVTFGDSNPNSITNLPITVLQLFQSKPNPDTNSTRDSPSFKTAFDTGRAALGENNVYASRDPFDRPSADARYIAGGNAPAEVAGGSYLVDDGASGSNGAFYFTISFRVVPALPGTYPRATSEDQGNTDETDDLVVRGDGRYAYPGVYTLNVKFVMVEC
uniref:Tlp-1 n=1 Tax=algae metagenome TaxID=1300146 RepID=A0ABD6GMS2_9ZZZZ